MKISLFLLTTLFHCGFAAGYGGINIQETISIGGIQQYIEIKGNHVNDPVLLFLHGGPGNSVMRSADRFTNELQKYFIVVQWDQRESGKTAKLNTSDKLLTVDQMEEDAVEVIRYLQVRFSKAKICLMGHSWGGFLALVIASKHSELLQACFAISPMVNQQESERLALSWMKEMAMTGNYPDANRELSQIKIPFENAEQLYYDRKYLALFSGQKPPSKDFVLTWSKKWFVLFTEAAGTNLFTKAPEIGCPVYFFVGSKDRQTHFEVTEAYFKAVKAEKKQLFWFNNSGHNLNLTESKKMQETVISVLQSKN